MKYEKNYNFLDIILYTLQNLFKNETNTNTSITVMLCNLKII